MADQTLLHLPSAIRVAQVVGITGSGVLAGLIGSFSYVAIPCLKLAPPNLLVRQWRDLFNLGVRTMPPVAVTGSLCYAWLAYSASQAGHAFPARLYGAAAVFLPAIVPWTFFMMTPTNALLFEKCDAAEKPSATEGDEGEARGLVAKWAALNYVRSALVATGAVLGVVASLEWKA